VNALKTSIGILFLDGLEGHPNSFVGVNFDEAIRDHLHNTILRLARIFFGENHSTFKNKISQENIL
jgi:hypothetical protein